MQKLQRGCVVKLVLSDEQKQQCVQYAGACRWVWNWALALRTEEYKKGKRIKIYDLMNLLPVKKLEEETRWLMEMPSQPLQQVLHNQELAFSEFFKRRAQYPVFKKRGVRDSFRFPQGFTLIGEAGLKLPKLGLVGMKGWNPAYRDWTPKSVTVFHKADAWYASILYEKEYCPIEHPNRDAACGIDMGVVHFATVYDGVEARHFDMLHDTIRWCEKKIAFLQSKLAKCKYGSNNRYELKMRIGRLFQRISNIRRDFQHKLSRKLVTSYKAVFVEDLHIQNMIRSASGTIDVPGLNVAAKRGLNRSIQRQAWRQFFAMLEYKAKETGSIVGIIDAKWTSQTCPRCLHTSKDNRKSQAVFECVSCGFSENADKVASMNVRYIGQRTLQSAT